MRVIFIKPYWRYSSGGLEATYNRVWPPLCLLNCAAILQQRGHFVKILDAHADRLTLDKIADYANGFDKIFITSSTLDFWQCPNIEITPFIDMVNTVAKNTSEVYCMGYHGTVMPDKILRSTLARAVIRGEPEETVAEICSGKDISSIKGISYRLDKKIISNGDRELLDMNRLPVPAFELIDFKKYNYELLGKSFIILEGSRGCRYKCSFCNKAMFKEGVRLKDAGRLIEEVKFAVERNNAKTCQFIDLDFASNKSLVEGLCEFLIKKKYDFKWSCQTRIDSVDKKKLEMMKKAGCALIEYGVETGSSKTAAYLKKNICLDQAIDSVRLTKEIGIKALCYFIVGFPGEEIEDIQLSFNFARKINPDYVSFHVAKVYQGAELGRNIIEKQYPDIFTGTCSNILSFKKLRIIVRNEMIRFYTRPQVIFREMFKEDINLVFDKIKLFLRYIF